MPRIARERTQDMAEQIKAVARRQMGAHGTAGLSLRAIAREMGITAPAIYNYFPRLEDLITALIVDAFTALAEAMETAADAAAAPGPVAPQAWAMVHAYRRWALAHPVDFQLIYGNPIPGYTAPYEVVGPLAFRPFERLFALYGQAAATGELAVPPEYQAVPATIHDNVAMWKAHAGFELPDAVVCVLMTGWGRIHGLVMLELFGHLAGPIGDPGALYAYEMRAFMTRLGFKPPG